MFVQSGGATLRADLDLKSSRLLLRVWSERDHGATTRAATLVDQAVSRARLTPVSHVVTVLDAASPSCGAVIERLRDRVGRDVESLDAHRSGSSVLVDVSLVPA